MDDRRSRRPFKVDRLLRPEHRAEYDALLTDPRTTGDAARAWLAAKGYAVGRSAVCRHRRHALREHDEVRRWAGVARHLAAAAREHGPAVLADGTLTQLEQMLLRALHAMSAAGTTPDPRQFADLATAVQRAVATRAAVDEHRRAEADRARATANGGKLDYAKLVRRVHYILGMPPEPGEPEFNPEEE